MNQVNYQLRIYDIFKRPRLDKLQGLMRLAKLRGDRETEIRAIKAIKAIIDAE